MGFDLLVRVGRMGQGGKGGCSVIEREMDILFIKGVGDGEIGESMEDSTAVEGCVFIDKEGDMSYGWWCMCSCVCHYGIRSNLEEGGCLGYFFYFLCGRKII